MEWTPEAKAAVQHVPFFVRKRVRARVEKEATDAGKERVTLADVKATHERYGRCVIAASGLRGGPSQSASSFREVIRSPTQ